MPRKKKSVSPKVAGIEKIDADTDGKIDAELKAQFLLEHEGDSYVKAVARKADVVCAACGKAITAANGVFASRKVFPSGYHPICLPCQQRFIRR